MNKKLLEVGYKVCRFIGDEINGESADCCEFEAVDENLISFLDFHNLMTVCTCILEDKNIDFKIESYNHRKAVYKQLKYDILADNLSKLFEKNHIKHILLKGKTIQKFYPENIVRTSSDVDFYITNDTVRDAVRLLENEGFSLIVDSDTDITLQKKPLYNIEFHTDMGGFTDAQKIIMNQIATNSLGNDAYAGKLSDSDIYIYALNHLYKHFVLSGAGVRMFLDIYLMTKNAQLDYDYINEVLKKLGIDGFSETVIQVNNTLFERCTPTSELEEVIEFIFYSGIFGTQLTFEHLTLINESVTDMSKLEFASVHYGIGFKAMRLRYPILKKLPFLYPFSFIHRFVKGMIFKREKFNNLIKSKNSISAEKIEQFERVFKIAKIK